MLPERSDAEDLVQDAFYRLWLKRETFRARGRLSSLLYTIVRHACLDYLRKLKSTTNHQETLLYLAEQESHLVENEVLQEELLRLIIQEIDALPAKYGTIVKMIYVEGLSYAEMSRQLNIPEATIRKQKERALKLLNNALLTRNDLPLWAIYAQFIFLSAFVTKG